MRSADFLFPDRRFALQEKRCIKPPFGCGKAIKEFPNKLSEREYNISALCLNCQKEIFGED